MIRTTWPLAALLAIACGGDPTDIGGLQVGAVCGYIEVPGSPFANETDGCERIRLTTPPDALLTPGSSSACDVEQTGTRCMVIAPGETFRIWRPMLSAGETWNADRGPVDCAATCDP